jgi:hypothetical protein
MCNNKFVDAFAPFLDVLKLFKVPFLAATDTLHRVSIILRRRGETIFQGSAQESSRGFCEWRRFSAIRL